MPGPDISFVVPAFNEERHLPSALEGIRAAMKGGQTYEVVVADHGSTDGTVAAAQAAGARVIVLAEARTIGELRNRAAAEALGRVLVFLDADVVLDGSWGTAFADVLRALSRDAMVVTGARLLVSPESAWVARTWFPARPGDRVAKHIGSGHMVVTRDLFQSVGGFPPDLETGEDYAFCAEARRRGARIVNDPSLIAYHLGAPKTLAQFWAREVWHGRGDARNLRTALASAVTWGAAAFAGAHAVLLLGLTGVVSGLWVSLALASVGLLTVGSTVRRMGRGDPMLLVRGSVLFYVYYWARAAALIAALTHGRSRWRSVRREKSPGTSI